MPCPRLNTCPGSLPAAAMIARAFRLDRSGGRKQRHGVQVALHRDSTTDIRRRASPMSVVQSTPRAASQPHSAMRSSHWPPPLVKAIARGMRCRIGAGARSRARHNPAKTRGRRLPQQATPGIEDHYRVGTMRNLLGEVRGDGVRVERQHAMQQVGPRVQRASYAREIALPAPSIM